MEVVVPGVLRIKRTWGSNVYIIPGEKPAMIDAGFPMDSKRVEKRLRRAGVESSLIVIATHYHLDHTGTIHKLLESFDVEIAAHSEDAPVMEGIQPYDTFKMDLVRTAYYKVLSPLFRYQFVDVNVWLEEGARIDVLGGLEVIHLPGHTDGSIGLYQRDRRILFSGDTIRNEDGLLEGPPPQFTPNLNEAFRSIERKILDLEFETLLPGHGEPIISGASKKVREMMRTRNQREQLRCR